MKFSFAAKTDIGRKRKENQDNLIYDVEKGLFVVADGMGGHLAGETASKFAVKIIYDYFNSPSTESLPQFLEEQDDSLSDEAKRLKSSICLANQLIFDSSQRNEYYRGMGSTIVAVMITPEHYSIANVGDSRLYLIRDFALEQITRDHSYIAEQVQKGLISEDEARSSGMRNVLTRVLGGDARVDVDMIEISPKKDDILVLCSDGLTNMLDDNEILNVILAYEDNIETASERLIELSNERGGVDNITVILLKIMELEDRSSRRSRFFNKIFKQSSK